MSGEFQVSTENEDSRTLMRRVSRGSEDATWELIERFGRAIQRAVRRALNKELRRKFDSLDFVQMA